MFATPSKHVGPNDIPRIHQDLHFRGDPPASRAPSSGFPLIGWTNGAYDARLRVAMLPRGGGLLKEIAVD
jgi:hypothetical protein